MSSLIVALPSKGRLQENAAAFFARAGMSLTQARGAREYRGALSGVEMGLSIAGVPHKKGGAQAAMDYLTECASGALRAAA